VFVQIFKILQVETELSTQFPNMCVSPSGDYYILAAFLDKNAMALTFTTVKSDVCIHFTGYSVRKHGVKGLWIKILSKIRKSYIAGDYGLWWCL
jgi:hypothetical protein